MRELDRESERERERERRQERGFLEFTAPPQQHVSVPTWAHIPRELPLIVQALRLPLLLVLVLKPPAHKNINTSLAVT